MLTKQPKLTAATVNIYVNNTSCSGQGPASLKSALQWERKAAISFETKTGNKPENPNLVLFIV